MPCTLYSMQVCATQQRDTIVNSSEDAMCILTTCLRLELCCAQHRASLLMGCARPAPQPPISRRRGVGCGTHMHVAVRGIAQGFSACNTNIFRITQCRRAQFVAVKTLLLPHGAHVLSDLAQLVCAHVILAVD